MTHRPLSEGNRFQRAYVRWAAPHYARMAPDMREQAELIDQFLYSRRGLGFWFGLLAAIVGSGFGLAGAGLPWLLAIAISLFVWGGLPLAALGAWLSPGKFAGRHLLRKLPLALLLASAGGVLGFAIAHVARAGRLDPLLLAHDLWLKLIPFVPVVFATALALIALMWAVARVRSEVLQRELARTRLEQERDAAAREATEAQLKLLRAQIQPHFIFNTLSALQHWVDSGDARAPALLRSLTAFLRGSTELLGSDEVTLGAEAAIVGNYLAIQQARLGARLTRQIDIGPDTADERIPPGLLLTLVENAVEHGIAPALAGGTVAVRSQRDGTALVISVADSGVGITPGWHEGVGLANCRQRLQHRFGPNAELQISALEHGTLARITVRRTPA